MRLGGHQPAALTEAVELQTLQPEPLVEITASDKLRFVLNYIADSIHPDAPTQQINR